MGLTLPHRLASLRYNRPFVVLFSILFVFLFYPLALVHSYYMLLALFYVRENWAGGKEITLKEHYIVFLPQNYDFKIIFASHWLVTERIAPLSLTQSAWLAWTI